MKKIIIGLCLLFLFGCNKDNDLPIQNNIQLSIGNVGANMDFNKSSNLKASAFTNYYLIFANNWLKNKSLWPPTYNIDIYEINPTSGAQTLFKNITGQWSDPLPRLSLKIGYTYKFKGYSRTEVSENYTNSINVQAKINNIVNTYCVASDRVFLKFDQSVVITNSTTNITLQPLWDCSLLLSDTYKWGDAQMGWESTSLTGYNTYYNFVFAYKTAGNTDYMPIFISNVITNSVAGSSILIRANCEGSMSEVSIELFYYKNKLMTGKCYELYAHGSGIIYINYNGVPI